MKRVIVIGAGAAGIMAAAAAARQGAETVLLEKKPRPLSKLAISGKGRCNVTTALPTEEQPLHYPRGGKFLYGALHRFSNQDLLALLSAGGCPTKIERGQRIFPCSDRAEDVARVLNDYARAAKVQLICDAPVDQVKRKGTGFIVTSGKRSWTGDALVIATGGLSYPGTGSTGDGYAWGEKWGHTLIPTRPGLVPLVVKEAWTHALSGVSLKNVSLSAWDGQRQIGAEFGEMLFTHYGVSGPIVLSLSRDIVECLSQRRPVTLRLDLKPALSEAVLDKRLQRDLDAAGRRQILSVLAGLAPRRLAAILLETSALAPEQPCARITREERLRLGQALKNLSFTVTKWRPIEEAIVTTGGISRQEISPQTMESRLVPNLYWAGEVIDVDGYTGGFNLQAAFSTGWVAGNAAGQEKG
jgi:predicted Rossmann fold flavoprotein